MCFSNPHIDIKMKLMSLFRVALAYIVGRYSSSGFKYTHRKTQIIHVMFSKVLFALLFPEEYINMKQCTDRNIALLNKLIS